MSARYYTMVSNEALRDVRAGRLEPAGLRLIREVGEDPALPQTLCEFEDADAPDWMNGCEVTPTISIDSPTNRIWVSARHLERSAQRSAEGAQKEKP